MFLVVLIDIYEDFRDVCMNDHGVDPVYDCNFFAFTLFLTLLCGVVSG